MFTNSVFRKDPFFNYDEQFPSEMDRVDRMMSEFWQPYHMPTTSPMMPSISPPLDNEGGRMERYRRRLSTIPLGRPRSHGDMFRNMETMFNEARNSSSAVPANAQSYSSSRVYSYSSDGVNEPRRYEACSETTQGPGGVRQTLNRERNSVTGKDRMQAGRYINDRGHVVERTEDLDSKEYKVNQDYFNIDANESDSFHQEWNQKAPKITRHVVTRNSGLGDRKLLKWQHGFSKNYDGSEFDERQMRDNSSRRITYEY